MQSKCITCQVNQPAIKLHDGILANVPQQLHASLVMPACLQVWKLQLPLAKLDIRCWTGPTMDIPLPGRVQSCLQHFADSSGHQLQAELGMPRLDHAESLHSRSKVRAA